MIKKRVKNIFSYVLSGVLIFGMTGVLFHASMGSYLPSVNAEDMDNVDIPEGAEYVEGQAIVCFRSETEDRFSASEELRFEKDIEKKIKGVDDADTIFEATDYVVGECIGDSSNGLITLVESDTLSTVELIEKLNKRNDVIYAEPNYKAKAASVDFTDRQFNGDGEYGIGVRGWNTYDGAGNPTPEVNTDGYVVAVIDSGVDYTNEDLSGVMWDEGLDYPSLTKLGGGKYGICTCMNNNSGEKYDSTDPMDDYYHGTHCAGIIAAEWNGFGVSGMASGAKIMAVKISNDIGYNTLYGAVKGYEYVIAAKKAGVNVRAANNSWHDNVFGHTMDIIVREAGENGIVSIFAAGNSSCDIDNIDIMGASFYNNPYAIIVCSNEEDGTFSEDFSNYGKRLVDVSAPGHYIFATIPNKTGSVNPYEYYMQRDGKDFIADYSDPSVVVMDNTDNSNFGFHASDGQGKCNMSIENVPGYGNMLRLDCDNEEGIVSIISDNAGDFSDSIGIGIEFYQEEKVSRYIMCYDPDKMDDESAEPTCSEADTFDTGIQYMGVNIPAYLDKTKGKVQITIGDVDNGDHIYIRKVFFCTKNLSYDYKSGTSMATPEVTGEAITLSAAFPEDGADKIAARIKGSVKLLPGFEDRCESGGLARLDMALDEETNPVINEVSLSGNVLKCEGFFFGENKGSLNIDGTDMPITEWNESSVSVQLPADFEAGEHRVEIVSSVGRKGHRYDRIGTPKYLYERLPLPGRSLSGTPGTYTVTESSFDDTFYNNEMKTLIGLDGDLYALIVARDQKTAIYKYDIEEKTWSMVYHGGYAASEGACTWKGKIFFLAYDELLDNSYTAVYDPETSDVSYKLVDDTYQYRKQTIVNNGNGVYIISGGTMKHDISRSDVSYGIRKLDEKTMTIKDVPYNDDYQGLVENMTATYDTDGNIYAIGGLSDNVLENSYCKIKINGDSAVIEDLSNEKEIVANTPDKVGTIMVASPFKDGIIISGRPSVDNDGELIADTFTAGYGVNAFSKTDKLISMKPVYSISAAAYRDRYYALGITNYEEGNHVFIGTDIETIPQPGDVVRIKSSSSKGGDIDQEGIIKSYVGADEEFNIVPDKGYELSYLTVDGKDVTDSIDKKNVYTFKNLVADHEIYAEFKKLDVADDVNDLDDADEEETEEKKTPKEKTSAEKTPKEKEVTENMQVTTQSNSNSSASRIVKTSDETSVILYIILGLLSFTGIIIIMSKRFCEE